jgi:hypothetical protein
MHPDISAWCSTCEEYVSPLSPRGGPQNVGACPWCGAPETYPTRDTAPALDPYDVAMRGVVHHASTCTQLALPFGEIEGAR